MSLTPQERFDREQDEVRERILADGKAERRRLSVEELESILAEWRAAGFDGLLSMPEDADGYPFVLVDLFDGCEIRDFGDRLELHGEPLTDECLRRAALVAYERWNGCMRLDGAWGPGEKDRLWLACQRLSPPVVITNHVPSPAIRRQAGEESARRGMVGQDTAAAVAARDYALGVADRTNPAMRAYVHSADAGDRKKIESMTGPEAAAFARHAAREGAKVLRVRPAAGVSKLGGEPEPAATGGVGQGATK